MAHSTNNRCEKAEPDLIAEARNGDQGAMAELFRRHYRHSIAVARRLLPAQEEFLDAVQSAYLSAFPHFRSFRAEASFRTWITRIVLNQCLIHLRTRRRQRIAMSLDEADVDGARPTVAAGSPTPEDVALRAEIDRIVADAAAKLSKYMGDVFTRCSISGFSARLWKRSLALSRRSSMEGFMVVFG
jgi:RNA polymerase sigma-70 factor (ECF subfamily)